MFQKVKTIKADNLKAYLPAWKSLISDEAIQSTHSDIKIDIPKVTQSNINPLFQYNFCVKQQQIISNDIF